MKAIVIFSAILFTSFGCFSQSIFKGKNQSFEVEYLKPDMPNIFFSYRTTELFSFSVPNLDSAYNLAHKAVEILAMKPNEDGSDIFVRINDGKLEIRRFAEFPKTAFILKTSGETGGGLKLDILEAYNLSNAIDKERERKKSQIVSKPAIYTQDDQRFSIEYLEVGGDVGTVIYWGYQDPKFSAIVKIISFSQPDIIASLKLVDKIIFMLGMEQTSMDKDINETFTTSRPSVELSLNRFGNNQKVIYILNKENGDLTGGLKIDLDLAKKLKSALLTAFSKEK
jgi:hypothetical protein